MKDLDTFQEEFRKNNENFEAWLNSVEGIIYDLNVIGDINLKDEKDKILIAKTLLKLPKKVREKTLKESVFVVCSACGTVREFFYREILKKEDLKEVPAGYIVSIRKPMIILNFSEMEKETEMDTIAHEIAHFILGHYKIEEGSNPKKEREADDLTEKWGFKRVYKEYPSENRLK